MRKHITVAAAEALAMNGWETVDIGKIGKAVFVEYRHPEKDGLVTVWSSAYNADIITYVGVDGVPEGYYDLHVCEYVEC